MRLQGLGDVREKGDQIIVLTNWPSTYDEDINMAKFIFNATHVVVFILSYNKEDSDRF